MTNKILDFPFEYPENTIGYQYVKYVAAHFIIHGTAVGCLSLRAFTSILTNKYDVRFIPAGL